MALIKCPECEEYIEDTLERCPKCGKEISLSHNVKNVYDKSQIESNSQLYDDIHQIAGDLRFIKNLIIVGLVCGVVLAVIGGLGML